MGGAARDTRTSAVLGIDISVGIAAEDQVTLRRMASALAYDGLAVSTEATSGEELALACDDAHPHAVALANGGAASDAPPAVRLVRDRLPRTRVVVVSPPVGGPVVRKTLEAGADGFVLESQIELTLAVTIRAVCAGQVAVPRETRHQVEKPALSYREKQILGMVVMGFTNSEIAAQLHLAESTVKSHLSSAFAKLGVRSRNEAAALILDPDGTLGPGILTISEGEASPTDPAGART
jgi:DNA-binding NarL/FixJ family response regulator